MIRTLKALAGVAVFFGSVAMAHAVGSPTTVYSSGNLHSTDAATEMTANLIAEPFSLDNQSLIIEVSFYTQEQATVGNPASSNAFHVSFYWFILADSGSGSPGAVLYSGVNSTTPAQFTRLDIGAAACVSCAGYREINNSITIPSDLLEASTTYWLIIHNGNPVTQNTLPGGGMFWDTTDTKLSSAIQPTWYLASPAKDPGSASYKSQKGGKNLTHVYRITGIECLEPGDCPSTVEPGTLALLGAGFGLSAIAGFRRKK